MDNNIFYFLTVYPLGFYYSGIVMYVRTTVNIREWCEQVETAMERSSLLCGSEILCRIWFFGGRNAIYFIEMYDFYRCTTAGAAALAFVCLHELLLH